MLHEIYKQLRPVKQRLARRRLLPALANGLLLGGWLGAIAGLICLLGQNQAAGIAGLAFVTIVPLGLAVRAIVRGATWNEAARAADRYAKLDDRITTALYLSTRPGPAEDELEQLQVEDALARMRQQRLASAVEVNMPWRKMLGGLLLSAIGVALAAWGTLAPPTLPKLRTRSSDPVYEVDVQRAMLPTPAIGDELTLDSASIVPQRSAEAATVEPPRFQRETAGLYFDRMAGQE